MFENINGNTSHANMDNTQLNTRADTAQIHILTQTTHTINTHVQHTHCAPLLHTHTK